MRYSLWSLINSILQVYRSYGRLFACLSPLSLVLFLLLSLFHLHYLYLSSSLFIHLWYVPLCVGFAGGPAELVPQVANCRLHRQRVQGPRPREGDCQVSTRVLLLFVIQKKLVVPILLVLPVMDVITGQRTSVSGQYAVQHRSYIIIFLIKLGRKVSVLLVLALVISIET